MPPIDAIHLLMQRFFQQTLCRIIQGNGIHQRTLLIGFNPSSDIGSIFSLMSLRSLFQLIAMLAVKIVGISIKISKRLSYGRVTTRYMSNDASYKEFIAALEVHKANLTQNARCIDIRMRQGRSKSAVNLPEKIPIPGNK